MKGILYRTRVRPVVGERRNTRIGKGDRYKHKGIPAEPERTANSVQKEIVRVLTPKVDSAK